jgi:hypothetical protein
MSIIDPNGNGINSKEKETNQYKIGSINLETTATPNSKLHEALSGARQMATMQLMMRAKQQAAERGIAIPEESLKMQAMVEASKIEDPFQMEPCAQAVFMLLANEIESRDGIIRELCGRVERLENELTINKEKLN